MSSRCPKYITFKDRAVAIKKQGHDHCNKCLYKHGKDNDCQPCQIKG